MRTANPALNSGTFSAFEFDELGKSKRMSIQGTVNKALFLLIVVTLSAFWSWDTSYRGSANTDILLLIGAFGGFIVGLVTVFKKHWVPYTAPLYALLEGIVLGVISAFYEASFPGIIIQAVALTFGTLFTLLVAYTSRLIKATENFKLGVVAATGGIVIVYIIDIVLHFFGRNIPFIHESGAFGIVFSLFVVAIAALNLVLDFDFIESGAAFGAPKYMEWYGAFGLMVTLIWLYLEILRLLAKLRSRKE